MLIRVIIVCFVLSLEWNAFTSFSLGPGLPRSPKHEGCAMGFCCIVLGLGTCLWTLHISTIRRCPSRLGGVRLCQGWMWHWRPFVQGVFSLWFFLHFSRFPLFGGRLRTEACSSVYVHLAHLWNITSISRFGVFFCLPILQVGWIQNGAYFFRMIRLGG